MLPFDVVLATPTAPCTLLDQHLGFLSSFTWSKLVQIDLTQSKRSVKSPMLTILHTIAPDRTLEVPCPVETYLFTLKDCFTTYSPVKNKRVTSKSFILNRGLNGSLSLFLCLFFFLHFMGKISSAVYRDKTDDRDVLTTIVPLVFCRKPSSIWEQYFRERWIAFMYIFCDRTTFLFIMLRDGQNLQWVELSHSSLSYS